MSVSEQDEAGTPAEGETIFDVDAWLTEARPPQRAVVVYGRGDLLSRLQELDAAPEAPTGRLGGSGRSREMAALREQIEASRRVLHVRALLNREANDLVAKHTKPPRAGESDGELDGFEYEVEAYSLALVEPTMSVEQVRRLHAAIGDAQWAAIGSAIQRANVETIDVPLSRLGSEGTEDS